MFAYMGGSHLLTSGVFHSGLTLQNYYLCYLLSYSLGTGDHQETHKKVICKEGEEENFWYISSWLIKNNSRHYKVRAINMHR